MSEQDQRYALMAAAAAAAYAQKKARDEARKALIISTALNQNMSSLDPKTQQQLRRLLEAESQRVEQENFDWQLGMWFGGIILGIFGLFFLFVLGAGSCSSSHAYTSTSAAYIAPQTTPTPEAATSVPVEVRRAEPVEVRRASRVRELVHVSTYAEYEQLPSGTDVVWPNGQRWTKP